MHNDASTATPAQGDGRFPPAPGRIMEWNPDTTFDGVPAGPVLTPLEIRGAMAALELLHRHALEVASEPGPGFNLLCNASAYLARLTGCIPDCLARDPFETPELLAPAAVH